MGRVYSKYDRMAGSIMAGQTTNYLFDYPTSTDYVKDGATAIETLADDVDATLFTALGGAYPGLRLVKKQTIGSGVSSIVVNDAFSATYENYKIIVSGGAANANDLAISIILGATNTGYYYLLRYDGYSGAAAYATVKGANTSLWNFVGIAGTNGIDLELDIRSPFLSKNSYFNSPYASSSNAGSNNGVLLNTTSYTDFSISIGGGNVTGGTIYVYGYGAS